MYLFDIKFIFIKLMKRSWIMDVNSAVLAAQEVSSIL